MHVIMIVSLVKVKKVQGVVTLGTKVGGSHYRGGYSPGLRGMMEVQL